jgi:hypothetical protein
MPLPHVPADTRFQLVERASLRPAISKDRAMDIL